MQQHWALAYLERSYDRDGVGPDSFNCWTFFQAVQREVFDRTVPDIPYVGILSNVHAFGSHAELNNWPEVDTPEDGDAVLLGGRTRPMHIGVWAATPDHNDGRVLHCDDGVGVVAQVVGDLDRRGWQVNAYRRYAYNRPPGSLPMIVNDGRTV